MSSTVWLAVAPSYGRHRRRSPPRSPATDRRRPRRRQPGGSTPAGLNAAIHASTGDVIVRVDGRAELCAGYIRRAVETLARTGAVNVGGVQRGCRRDAVRASSGAWPITSRLRHRWQPFPRRRRRRSGRHRLPRRLPPRRRSRRSASSTRRSSATRTTSSTSACARPADWCGSTRTLSATYRPRGRLRVAGPAVLRVRRVEGGGAAPPPPIAASTAGTPADRHRSRPRRRCRLTSRKGCRPASCRLCDRRCSGDGRGGTRPIRALAGRRRVVRHHPLVVVRRIRQTPARDPCP